MTEELRRDRLGALKTLHERYFVVLCLYARKFVSNEKEAGDIVQETFLQFFNASARFKDIPAIEKYLFKVTYRRALNYFRHRKRNETESSELHWERAPTDVTNGFIEAEMLRYVLLEITRLPKTYRTVFEMVLVEGLSIEEIAQRLDLTVNNIQQIKSRGVEWVRVGLFKQRILESSCLVILILTTRVIL
ncbi:MAG: sigma-70 family RNA polymerase sigma factor [Puia sp.]|nr:sigma-70 family RNA polymerase sigma factor [Puia sp.]